MEICKRCEGVGEVEGIISSSHSIWTKCPECRPASSEAKACKRCGKGFDAHVTDNGRVLCLDRDTEMSIPPTQSTEHSMDFVGGSAEKQQAFGMELTALINTYSLENDSDTPDIVLSTYLLACLKCRYW